MGKGNVWGCMKTGYGLDNYVVNERLSELSHKDLRELTSDKDRDLRSICEQINRLKKCDLDSKLGMLLQTQIARNLLENKDHLGDSIIYSPLVNAIHTNKVEVVNLVNRHMVQEFSYYDSEYLLRCVLKKNNEDLLKSMVGILLEKGHISVNKMREVLFEGDEALEPLLGCNSEDIYRLYYDASIDLS